jgi:hypothetical protein
MWGRTGRAVAFGLAAMAVATSAAAAEPPRAAVGLFASAPDRHVHATWSLPDGVAAGDVTVANHPFQGSDGGFFTENIKLVDLLQPSQTTYVSTDPLDPGTYWISVQTFDNDCSYAENNSCFAWSPPVQFTVDEPPNAVPKMTFRKWTADFAYNAMPVMRVCDDTDGRLTFRSTLTHRRNFGRGRIVTQRRVYSPYTQTTYTQYEMGCETYEVEIPVLRDLGVYTLRLTVTDARGATSKPFVKRFVVAD